MLNDFRQSFCPLCDSSQMIRVGSIRYEEPILFSSTVMKFEQVPELWRCKHCQSGFVQNVLSEDLARNLYSQGDSTSRWSTMSFEEQKPQEIVAELSRLCTSGKKLLDVGCNAGDLLDFARARGCSTTGVDYSSKTRDFIERKGHTWSPTLETVERSDFDVITAFDLIEHLYDVRAFLQECCRRLRPGGRLVILTGNIACVSAQLARQYWWYIAYPEHVVFPSVRFFRSSSAYTVEKLIPTYAAAAHKNPLQDRLRGFLSGMLRGRYHGFPALGPDHMLLVLEK